MKQIFPLLAFLLTLLSGEGLHSQSTVSPVEAEYRGLESLILETYCIHSKTGMQDSKTVGLPEGYVTYRLYIDMAPGYKLQGLYGSKDQPLVIETTTGFYNNQDFGAKSGSDINDALLNDYNLAFDSWISLGAATSRHIGVLKEEDYDGSILKNALLIDRDGMISGITPVIHYYNMIPSFFQREDSSTFKITNGAWTVYEGIQGPGSSNRVLIAQLTTDGFLSVSLNVQLLAPEKETIRFVAKKPCNKDVLFEGLNINKTKSISYEIRTFTRDYME